MTTFELTRQQVAEPLFQQWRNATQKEHPYAPTGCPKADTGSLADRTDIEAIINQMLQILAGSNLTHKTILVAIHAGKLTDVIKGVLQTVGELVCVNVRETILNVRIDNKLGEAEDFTHEMKGVSESRFFAFLGGECLGWFEIATE